MSVEEAIFRSNPWFAEGKVPEALLPSTTQPRIIFDEIYSTIGNLNRITVIRGVRRVGKTTLMRQLIAKTLESENKFCVLYFNFKDAEVGDVKDPVRAVFAAYEKILAANNLMGSNIYSVKERIYLFFDEVQVVPNYRSRLFTLYEEIKNVAKIFISGSSALSLVRTSESNRNESLYGRVADKVVYPVSFREYISYKHPQISEALTGTSIVDDKIFSPGQLVAVLSKNYVILAPYINNLAEKYVNYLFEGGLPEVVFRPEEEDNKHMGYLHEAYNNIRDDIITKLPSDVREEFESGYSTDIIVSVIEHVAANPGAIIVDQNAASDLGKDRLTFRRYINVLKNALIIFELYNSSAARNKLVKRTKLKKLYLADNSFIVAMDAVLRKSIGAYEDQKNIAGLQNAMMDKAGITADDIKGSSFARAFIGGYAAGIMEFIGKLNENLIAAFLASIFGIGQLGFSRLGNGKELDFVVYDSNISKRSAAGIEVTVSEDLRDTIKTYNKVAKAMKLSSKVLLGGSTIQPQFDREDGIIVIPAWLFLLSCSR